MPVHPPARRQAGRRRCRPAWRLGLFPGTDEKITLRTGRFGPYVQLGEGDKPKRSGMPKGTDKSRCRSGTGAEAAVAAARSRRCIPKTASRSRANFGRFGPYVAHDGIYASLESPEDVFEIGLNHAVTLLAEKKAKGPGRRGAQALKELGAAPDGNADQGAEGPFGPYVSDGETNATLPEGTEPDSRDPGTGAGADRRTRGQGRRKKKKAAKAPRRKPRPKPKKSRRQKSRESKTAAKKKAAKPPKAKPPAKAKKAEEPEWQANRN